MTTELTTIVPAAGTENEGSHVPSQGLATEQGFSNVSAPWYEKTIAIEEGIEQLAKINQERENREFLFNRSDIGFSFNPESGFSVSLGDEGEYSLTDHAAGKLCGWMNVPIALYTEYGAKDRGYTAEQRGDILTRAFNYGKESFGEKAKKDLLFKVSDASQSIHFVASDEYDTVTNEWYLESLAKIVPGARLSHFAKTDGFSLYGNLLIPDTLRETHKEFGAMVSLSNCEIGKRILGACPALFRYICMNGCVWGETKGVALRKRHRGIDSLDEMFLSLKSHIEKQIPLAVQAMELVPELHRLTFAKEKIESIFASVVSLSGVSSSLINRAYDEWNEHSGETTAFGVMDGITRAGQNYSASEWSAADSFAGELLVGGAKTWERVTSKAKSLTTKEVGKLLGKVAV